MHRGTVRSEEGVKQGDTLGSLLFALSMQGLYRRCAQNLPNVRCIAVADDLNIIGSADGVFKAFGRFERSLVGTGLSLRKDKCAVLWPKVSDPPELVRSSATRLGLPLHRGTMQTLGVLVGSGSQQMHAWLERQIDSYKEYLELLLHPELPAQVAMILLRLSVIPQLGYLARVVPPSLLAPHALRFDDMVLDVVQRKFLLPSPLPDVAKFFLSLPIKVGGFGLRKARDVSCPAYFCAVSAAAEGILELLPVERRLLYSLMRRPALLSLRRWTCASIG